MAKNVFKPQEIMYRTRKVFIEPPKIEPEEPEAIELAPEEYTGPTVEDIRREAGCGLKLKGEGLEIPF